MLNKQKIKILAQIAAKNDKIPIDIEEYVLKCLSKKDLKDFLRFYKTAIDKTKIYVSSPEELSNEGTNLLKNLYKDKDIVLSIDKTLGAGLKLKEDDMIVDFTFKKYINDTIEKLKN